ncbi:hypothetical protein BDN72DRAFT_958339 [Pluteus cervinus]|uniref:Uncharacterized protein n=1 Tax=Pluteus cervinus TaxID=181527 RepID=A0ACD3B1F2_9AGAR|nr:hypothetical protein BDN72DRAFT_958339 [Pluteus cervinus]
MRLILFAGLVLLTTFVSANSIAQTDPRNQVMNSKTPEVLVIARDTTSLTSSGSTKSNESSSSSPSNPTALASVTVKTTNKGFIIATAIGWFFAVLFLPFVVIYVKRWRKEKVQNNGAEKDPEKGTVREGSVSEDQERVSSTMSFTMPPTTGAEGKDATLPPPSTTPVIGSIQNPIQESTPVPSTSSPSARPRGPPIVRDVNKKRQREPQLKHRIEETQQRLASSTSPEEKQVLQEKIQKMNDWLISDYVYGVSDTAPAGYFD